MEGKRKQEKQKQNSTELQKSNTEAEICLFFEICHLRCHNFSSKEQVSFNFMEAVTIYSYFGAKNIFSHCFHCFPMYLP